MAIVPMGHLNDPFNTFYESFTQSASGAWKLSTLPGVGTNGGLSLTSPSAGVVGVLPFDVSPGSALMQLKNGIPIGNGEVISALAHSPSAIAVHPLKTAVSVLLANGTVRTQTKWSSAPVTTTSMKTLRNLSAGATCGIKAVTALAYEVNGDLALGVRCAKGGTTGVLVDHNGNWSMSSFRNNSAGAVIRLDADGAGLLALYRTQGSKSSLRSLYLEGTATIAGSTYSLSGRILRATAVTGLPTQTCSDIVTLATSKNVVGIVLTPGSSPKVTPTLPLSTQAIVASGNEGRTITAVEVNERNAIFQILTPSATWQTIQTMKISVPYGSAA
jgi:hypothetical protein